MDWFEVDDLKTARRRPVGAREPLDDQLKCLFQAITTGPLPDGFTELADRLEEAFQNGELRRNCAFRAER